MKKYFPLSLLSLLLFVPKVTFAFVPLVCDLCTVGVIAGLGISRYFGIDDSIT
jgi:predicted RND superfamily exporter protein